MANIKGFINIVEKIKKNLNEDKKDLLLYAFNATGKTRLSYEFNIESEDSDEIETLCYNSIVEDYFTWNNDSKEMFIDKDSWIFRFIDDEGLEGKIIDNYSVFIDTRLEPSIDFKNGKIQFRLLTGDENNNEFVKISKGEETLFKWTVFYTVLDHVLEILNDKEEDRSTTRFNHLKCVIIDDPVSSLDDYRIYTLSMKIIQSIQYAHEKELGVQFLISTHHTLFYNIIMNSMKKRNRRAHEKFISYLLFKKDDDTELQKLNTNEPITYHLEMLKEITEAIEDNKLQKKHFNIFRSLLEKSAIFLGYDNWQVLFKDYIKKQEIEKLLNMNSHERYSELEMNRLTQEQIDGFTDGYEYFKNNYKFNI